MNTLQNLIIEEYNKVIKELEDNIPSEENKELGDITASLAQAKGELATILDRAFREKVIDKNNGKIKILNREEYLKRVGDLPNKIKQLQQQLEPEDNED